VHRIKIELTKDGTNYYTIPNAQGGDYHDVDTGTLDNHGSYTWTVKSALTGLASTIGETIKIRISDYDLSNEVLGESTGFDLARRADQSLSNYTITGSINVEDPPDSWKIGETQNINWTYKGKLSTLANPGNTVTISINPGAGWVNLITDRPVGTDGSGEADGSGSYPWTIPPGVPVASPAQNLIGADNIIRVSSNYSGSTIKDETREFTLKGRIKTVTRTPDTTWLLGQTVTISWTKDGYFGTGINNGNVKIYYAPDGSTYTELTDDTGLSQYPVTAGLNGNSVTWVIPKTTITSAPASKIKVVQDTDETVYLESSAFYLQPSLDITYPLDGDILRFGQSTAVEWLPHGDLGHVDIKYTTDNWNSSNTIAAGVDAGTPEVPQSKAWTVNNPIGLDVKLRISKSDDASIYKEVAIQLKPVFIEALVTQQGSAQNVIHVTDPLEGNTATISWKYLGDISNGHADIYLSTNGTQFPVKMDTGDLNINNAGGAQAHSPGRWL